MASLFAEPRGPAVLASQLFGVTQKSEIIISFNAASLVNDRRRALWRSVCNWKHLGSPPHVNVKFNTQTVNKAKKCARQSEWYLIPQQQWFPNFFYFSGPFRGLSYWLFFLFKWIIQSWTSVFSMAGVGGPCAADFLHLIGRHVTNLSILMVGNCLCCTF